MGTKRLSIHTLLLSFLVILPLNPDSKASEPDQEFEADICRAYGSRSQYADKERIASFAHEILLFIKDSGAAMNETIRKDIVTAIKDPAWGNDLQIWQHPLKQRKDELVMMDSIARYVRSSAIDYRVRAEYFARIRAMLETFRNSSIKKFPEHADVVNGVFAGYRDGVFRYEGNPLRPIPAVDANMLNTVADRYSQFLDGYVFPMDDDRTRLHSAFLGELSKILHPALYHKEDRKYYKKEYNTIVQEILSKSQEISDYETAKRDQVIMDRVNNMARVAQITAVADEIIAQAGNTTELKRSSNSSTPPNRTSPLQAATLVGATPSAHQLLDKPRNSDGNASDRSIFRKGTLILCTVLGIVLAVAILLFKTAWRKEVHVGRQ